MSRLSTSREATARKLLVCGLETRSFSSISKESSAGSCNGFVYTKTIAEQLNKSRTKFYLDCLATANIGAFKIYDFRERKVSCEAT